MNKKTAIKKIFTLLLLGSFLPLAGKSQIADSSVRLFKMEHAANFRDVGGYKTAAGKTVKWGRIYRSADISKLTDQDLKTFEERSIKQVFDFRGKQEAASAPDKLPAETRYTLCSAGSNHLGKDAMPNLKDLNKLPNFLIDFYGNVDSLAIRYKPLFQAMLTSTDKEAILYHCTGGRDRTGIATALVLYSLGVPQKTIEEDYIASNYYLKNSNKAMFSKMGTLSDEQIEAISKALELKPVYLQTTFKALEKRYGSIDQFFKDGLGINEQARKELVNKYTE